MITPWLLETIFRLRDVGVEVEVLAPSYRGLADQELQGIRVHRFRYAPALLETLSHDQTVPDRLRARPWYSLLLPGYLIGGIMKARRLARSGRFDVFHAFWPVPHSVIGDLGRIGSGIPLVSTFFGVELTWVRRDLPFLSGLLRWIVRRSDAVTAISAYTADQLARYQTGAKAAVVPFGAAISHSAPAAAANRREPDTAVGLLFIGRLVERKGVAHLLRALERMPRGDYHLKVAGDGPLRAELENLAHTLGVAEDVTFMGFVPDDDLAATLGACDVLILPAVEDSKGDVEGLGVVLLEAIQAGKPVIASRSGGITDIVVDEESGLLVEPGDSAGLAAAIQRLREDPELRERLVAGGLRRVEDRFSWERIVGDLEKIYVDVSNQNQERGLRNTLSR